MRSRVDPRAAQRWNTFYRPDPPEQVEDLFTGCSLSEQIRELERELAVRRNVYPRMKIEPRKAAYQIRCLEAAIATLKARQ